MTKIIISRNMEKVQKACKGCPVHHKLQIILSVLS